MVYKFERSEGRGDLDRARDQRSSEPAALNSQTPVYELWSDEDLRWVEINLDGQLELMAFLEAWCAKNRTIFRRRPHGRTAISELRPGPLTGPEDHQGLSMDEGEARQ